MTIKTKTKDETTSVKELVNRAMQQELQLKQMELNTIQNELNKTARLWEMFNTFSDSIDKLDFIDQNQKQALADAGIKRVMQLEAVLRFDPDILLNIKGIGEKTVSNWIDAYGIS